MTKIMNFWAGPGTGKSTVAADTFAEMKWRGHNVELISEYAKQKTWEKHHDILQDQLYISAKQNRKIRMLLGQVDWIISDSPLLMCAPYVPDDFSPFFIQTVRDVFNSYDNVNFFLRREKEYNPIGRNQTYEQACELDNKIKALMLAEAIEYTELPANRDTKYQILDQLGL